MPSNFYGKPDNLAEEGYRCAEQVHWRLEEREWKWQRWIQGIALGLSAFAVLSAVGGFYITIQIWHEAIKATEEARREANAALSQANIAKDTLTATTRPWIKDTGIKVEKLEVQKGQVLVWAEFRFANIGRSPAAELAVFPRLLIPELEPWGFREAKKACDEVRRHPNMVAGSALFPGESGSITMNFGRPMRDIQRGQKAYLKSTYDQWALAFGKEQANQALPSFVRMANYTGFSIVGCIAYTFVGSSTVHGTSFAYHLARNDPDTRNGVTSQVVDTSRLGTISGSELRPTKELLGRYAD